MSYYKNWIIVCPDGFNQSIIIKIKCVEINSTGFLRFLFVKAIIKRTQLESIIFLHYSNQFAFKRRIEYAVRIEIIRMRYKGSIATAFGNKILRRFNGVDQAVYLLYQILRESRA
jgi:hypothetical protein